MPQRLKVASHVVATAKVIATTAILCDNSQHIHSVNLERVICLPYPS